MLEYFMKYKSTKKNIKLIETAEGFVVKYHHTEIVELEDSMITLRHGGWLTRSTIRHINAVLRDFNMSVCQKNYLWYVYGQGLLVDGALPFKDGMKIPLTIAVYL